MANTPRGNWMSRLARRSAVMPPSRPEARFWPMIKLIWAMDKPKSGGQHQPAHMSDALVINVDGRNVASGPLRERRQLDQEVADGPQDNPQGHPPSAPGADRGGRRTG